jgi:hypothetical protein
MEEAPSSSETRFLEEPHGVISQKTPFFMSGFFQTMRAVVM